MTGSDWGEGEEEGTNEYLLKEIGICGVLTVC